MAVRKEINVKRLLCDSLKYISVGIFMLVALFLIKRFYSIGVVELILLIFIGAAFYIIGLLLLAILWKDSL